MRLYNSIGPNPKVVRMFLAEKGLDLPITEIGRASCRERV